jgi:hypothetical protein
MESLDEIIEQLKGMKLYGSSSIASSAAADAYVSLMKEINKIAQESTVFNKTRGKFYMTAKDALTVLYPYEYEHQKTSFPNESDEYNLLIDLITMSDKRVIRPLPKISNVPKEAILRFSDFSKISTKTNTMEITMEDLLDKKKMVLDFDAAGDNSIHTYKSVLFVESTEEYKGYAIPFLYIKTHEEVSIFQSPYIFKDNIERWEIRLKGKQ